MFYPSTSKRYARNSCRRNAQRNSTSVSEYLQMVVRQIDPLEKLQGTRLLTGSTTLERWKN